MKKMVSASELGEGMIRSKIREVSTCGIEGFRPSLPERRLVA